MNYRGTKTIPDPAYSDSKIYLYGVPVDPFNQLPGANGSTIVIQPQAGSGNIELAIVYGYAYQGHCYRLERPSLFLVDLGTRQDATGCGYGDDYLLNTGALISSVVRYSMWIVDKLDNTTKLEIQTDTFEQLLLQANLPTSKQPSSYNIAFTMGHRSGKLTE
jgi:hypothetical protein